MYIKEIYLCMFLTPSSAGNFGEILSKIYDVPMKFASKLIHGGQSTITIDLCILAPAE